MRQAMPPKGYQLLTAGEIICTGDIEYNEEMNTWGPMQFAGLLIGRPWYPYNYDVEFDLTPGRFRPIAKRIYLEADAMIA